MKKYRVKIDPEALTDIREITYWYNEAQTGLGKKFQNTVIKQINSLSKDPHSCAVRYKKIRCMIVRKFPFMVHFYINIENNTVEILAVISTYRNPRIWEEKTSRH